jgi:hypothetical protein
VNKLVVLAMLALMGVFACWRGLAGSGGVSQDLAREAKRSQTLEHESHLAQRRVEAKQLVIAEVIAGRMGLAKATRRFAEINATGTEDAEAPLTYLSFNDEEACSRNVLKWARAALAGDAKQAARILPALEEEYQQRFKSSPSGN